MLRIQDPEGLGFFVRKEDGTADLNHWEVASSDPAVETDLARVQEAAAHLRTRDTPVGFPTETVYGLGADATRSSAVRSIYAAKGRPSDNPLIVHVSDLTMLRSLLSPSSTSTSGSCLPNGDTTTTTTDPIPPIYHPLIAKFWPGPLTILLPLPSPSPLAREVTAGLGTFGARLPASALARTLIGLAGRPLAAPSANASTRPSTTTAAHVLHDLAGRIELVLDGGACGVGVESTVVDGLCDPPVVLRPGGVSLDALRACPGWEAVVSAYRDVAEVGGGQQAPRAPGMKYKHYSPRARVVLFEVGGEVVSEEMVWRAVREAERGRHGEGGNEVERVRRAERGDEVEGEPRNGDVESQRKEGEGRKEIQRTVVGIIRTRRWPAFPGLRIFARSGQGGEDDDDGSRLPGGAVTNGDHAASYELREGELEGPDGQQVVQLLDIDLGRDIKGIAQGLFAALRELDQRGASVILVEGIDDSEDIAAAVMNRLRKAASDIRS